MSAHKLHKPDDLLRASMVWISRGDQIKQVLTAAMPHLSLIDIDIIVSGCRLYTTCDDELFEQVVDNALKVQGVKA